MNNPIITASGAIPAYACVKVSTSGSERVEVATSAADVVFGVTLAANTANGAAIDFQTTDSQLDIFTLKAAGTIAIGQYVVPTTNGTVAAATTGPFVSLEAATTGQTFTARKFNAGATANFLAPGTGAITRTLDSKLADTISVKDFGAVGDGVADDTAAIQAALNSGAKTILCPIGTYKVTSTLFIPGSTGTTAVSFVGEGTNTVINANSITGSVICNYQGAWTGFKNYQYLKNLRISGTATHGVLWSGGVNGGIENISMHGLTATNGFIFDGSFACSFRHLSTQGATISNACFWFSRDFNANTVDTAYTSNFCTVNFLWTKVGISSVGSPYDGGSPSGFTTMASCFNNICTQGGNTGLAIYELNPGGATFNAVYVENVVLPVQFGKFSTSELCRGVTMNNLGIIGVAAVSHPAGPSTMAVDFDNALNVTLVSPEFGNFGDATTPAVVRYQSAYKCSIINYHHITGGLGSSMTTGQIRRHVNAISDSGIYVQGQENDAASPNARSHFLFMKSNAFGFQHFKMSLNNLGVWVPLSVTPAIL